MSMNMCSESWIVMGSGHRIWVHVTDVLEFWDLLGYISTSGDILSTLVDMRRIPVESRTSIQKIVPDTRGTLKVGVWKVILQFTTFCHCASYSVPHRFALFDGFFFDVIVAFACIDRL